MSLAETATDDVPEFLRRNKDNTFMNAVAPKTIDIEPDTTAVAVRQQASASVVAISPMDMISRAVASGASMELIERLMALQERVEANQARKEFDAAIADAKAEISPVVRNAKGHNEKRYADFAAIARAVDPVISKFGLSYRFRTAQADRISVTCVLSHKAGHFEETTLAGPPDTTGSKNAIQAIGSTLTYLQRYSLVQALGLAAADDDDAKGGGKGDTITDEQVEQLQILIVKTKSNIDQFCKVLKVDCLPDIQAGQFDQALKLLKEKERRMEAKP